MALSKQERRQRIRYRIRRIVRGSGERPRMSVFRSNKEIYVQLIDDVNGVSLAAASSREKDFAATGTKTDKAKTVGQKIAEKALALGIDTCTFDRAGYLYHGRVKALADGAREGGLKF